MIMQENRSFDSYFGTYPGANGIPGGVCVPDPVNGGCAGALSRFQRQELRWPSWLPARRQRGHRRRQDGRLRRPGVERGTSAPPTNCELHFPAAARKRSRANAIDVMGYHDAREIPNYWTYAQNFVLQDNMFESAAFVEPARASLPGLRVVCRLPERRPQPDGLCRAPCRSTPTRWRTLRTAYAWTDITYLLDKAHVSWRYYVFEGAEPDCESDEAITCEPVQQGLRHSGIWNPLADFTDVKQDDQLEDIQSLTNFYTAVHDQSGCGLPNVSWIDPERQCLRTSILADLYSGRRTSRRWSTRSCAAPAGEAPRSSSPGMTGAASMTTWCRPKSIRTAMACVSRAW